MYVFRTAKSTHHPHKIDDQHRECKTGGGAYFAFFFRPAVSGGMDWWRMEWPFSRARKIFIRGRIFQEDPWNSEERAIFAKVQAPKFENSEPEKLQFHTPSHSTPPLDSLLFLGSDNSHTTPPKNSTRWGRSVVGMVRGSRSPGVVENSPGYRPKMRK